MIRHIKNHICAFLAVLSALPAIARDFSYEGLYYTIINEWHHTCQVKGGTLEFPGNPVVGDITVPSKVSDGTTDFTVIAVGEYAFLNCDGLTSIKIPDEVTSIGSAAFMGCSNLTSIRLPQSLTTIDYSLFDGCSSLTTITLPEKVSIIRIDAFRNCTSLESISLPEGMTTLEQQTFENCTGLKSVMLPENLTTIEHRAFGGCSSLASIIIPKNVTSIGTYAFTGCSNLTSVTLPDGLSYIEEDVFLDCSSLTSINLPSGLTSIKARAFSGCSSLGSITFPSGLSFIGSSAFNGCRSLAAVALPKGIQSIEPSTFNNCESLTGVTIPNSVTDIKDYAFDHCSSLSSVIIPEGVTFLGEFAFGFCTSLASIELPASLTTLDVNSFRYSDIKDVTYYAEKPITTPANIFPKEATLHTPNAYLADVLATVCWNQFRKIIAKDGISEPKLPLGELDFEYNGIVYTIFNNTEKTCKTRDGIYVDSYLVAGNQCSGDLVIPSVVSDGADNYTVVGIGNYSFSGCPITSVSLPETVTFVENDAFKDCENLRKAEFASIESLCKIRFYNSSSNPLYWAHNLYVNGEELTQVVVPKDIPEILDFTFAGGSSLLSITLPETITSIGGGAFQDCSTLTSIKLPVGIERINSFTFSGCSSLTSLTLPESVNSIDMWAFNNCTSLTSITLPKNLSSIGYAAFSGCNNLTSIVIPESVTDLGEYAFSECSALSSVSLPTQLRSIELYTFYKCKSLTQITLPENLENIGVQAFRESGLTSIELPDKVSTIGEGAFVQCYELTAVTLSKEIFSIGNSAFYGCNKLSSITWLNPNLWSPDENVFYAESDAYISKMKIYDTAILNVPEVSLSIVESTVPWNNFHKIIAMDGTRGLGTEVGEDFEYEGITYTVTNNGSLKWCKTKDGTAGAAGNALSGDVVIPEIVSDGFYEYSVTEIGKFGFIRTGITSIVLPSSLETFGEYAFFGCDRLSSVYWQHSSPMPNGIAEATGNENILVYVDSKSNAPEDFEHNIIVKDGQTDQFYCDDLQLKAGYSFRPLYPFTSQSNTFVKSFTQKTPNFGCAGWDSMVVPFDVEEVSFENRTLIPFATLTDIRTQHPFWLYEGDASGEWRESTGIRAGVPYLISMPNNRDYEPQYCVSGDVTFRNNSSVLITEDITTPYVVTWATGREFRSLWMPLDNDEAANAMGLNANINDLTDDNGEILLPGSAFHKGVVPKPLEAYVTAIDSSKSFRIAEGMSKVLQISDNSDLEITNEHGMVVVKSGSDRTVNIFSIDGVMVKNIEIHAGETVTVSDLTKGIYIIGNRKISVR